MKIAYRMRDRPDDLIAAIVVTVAMSAIVVFLPDSWLRIIVGLTIALFLPGYTAAAALFPGKADIDPVERVALSAGLSIVVIALSGLALNYTSFGVRLEPMLAVISAFVIVASLIAWRRRIYLPEEERFRIGFELDLGMRGMPIADRVLNIAIIITVAATLVLLSYLVAVPRNGESFTQLAILNSSGIAADYPRNLSVGEGAEVIVCVGSSELQSKGYSLVISLQNSSVNGTTHWAGDPFSSTVALDAGIALASNFSLDPDEWMNESFSFSVLQTGTFKLRFMLYLEGEPLSAEPYREVYLWLFVS